MVVVLILDPRFEFNTGAVQASGDHSWFHNAVKLLGQVLVLPKAILWLETDELISKGKLLLHIIMIDNVCTGIWCCDQT